MKVVRTPEGAERGKPELDDVVAAARALGRDLRSVARRYSRIPIFCCTTWDRDSMMGARIFAPAAGSGERRRCGESA